MDVLLMFTGASCAPCRVLKPRVESLCNLRGVGFKELDAGDDQHAALLTQYQVKQVPTVIWKAQRYSGMADILALVKQGL